MGILYTKTLFDTSMEYNRGFTNLIAMVVAIGGFLLGFDSAVISGAIPFITDFFALNELQTGWAVSCLILGSIAGNSLAGPLSDEWGRRKILMITAVLFLISAISSALANTFWFFIVARIIGGVGVGGALLIAPVYIAEVSPPNLRGQLVSFNQLNIVIGISLAYFSNYFLLQLDDNNWRWMLGIEAIPALLYFLFLYFVPDSPRWLIQKEFKDKAFNVMKKVGGSDYARHEMNEITESVSKEKIEGLKTQLRDFFSGKMKFIIFIALTLGFFQQITGINAVLYYAPTIFKKTGIGTDAAFIQAAIVGLTNLSFTVLAMALIDKIGRKPLLLAGCAGMTISLFILTYFAHYQSFTGYGVLVAILGYVASFAVSLGPVLWVILSEIFPNRFRGLGISIAGLWASIISFSVTLLFPWEIEYLGKSITFLIYALLALLAFLFVFFIMPETKGKSLEQLEKILFKNQKLN